MIRITSAVLAAGPMINSLRRDVPVAAHQKRLVFLGLGLCFVRGDIGQEM